MATLLEQMQEINERNDFSYKNHTKPNTDVVSYDSFLDETIEMAEVIHYKDGYYGGLLNRAIRLMAFGNYAESYKIVDKMTSDQIVEDLSVRYRLLYYNYLTIYYADYVCDLNAALVYAKNEMKLAEQLGDNNQLMRTKMNIGTFNIDLKFYDTAIEFLEESLAYYESVDDRTMMSYCCLNLADSKTGIKAYGDAMALYKRAYDLSVIEQEQIIVYSALHGLAKLYKAEGNYNEAIVCLDKALKVLEGFSVPHGEAEALIEQISIYKLSGQYDAAVSVINKVESQLDILDNISIQKAYYQDKAAVYEAVGDMVEAYTALKKYVELTGRQDVVADHKSMNEVNQKEHEKTMARLEAIASVGRKLTVLSDLDEVLISVERELAKVMPINGIGVGEIRHNKLVYNHMHENGRKVKSNAASLEDPTSLAAWSIRNNELLVINNIEEEYNRYVDGLLELNDDDELPENSIHSLMYAPLSIEDEVFGVFTVQSYEKDVYSSLEAHVFTIIADYVAIAARNVEQKRKLTQLSVRDTLTGMYNRRGFTDFFEKMVLATDIHNTSASIIMLDLDYFKSINDTFGHLAGDDILCAVADCLMDLESEGIRAGRLGGEEFGLVVFNRNLGAVEVLAEDLRRRIESLEVMIGRHPVKVTTSIGVAYMVCEHSVGYNRFYSEADKALYRAKELGRNRVEVTEVRQ